MNDELRKMQSLVYIIRHYSETCLKGLTKTTKHLIQDNRLCKWNMKPERPEYEMSAHHCFCLIPLLSDNIKENKCSTAAPLTRRTQTYVTRRNTQLSVIKYRQDSSQKN